MAVRFPDTDPIDPVKDHINHDFTHMVAFGKKNESSGELRYPNDVAIDPATNRIYVAEGTFAKVSIFSKTGGFLNSYTHKDMKSLFGIAIHDDHLYVTDWSLHGVLQFKIGSEFLLVGRIGGKGSDLGEFHYPRQLTISSHGELFIADSGNHRIQILSSSLNPTKKISHPSMHTPRDVKLATNEIYVLSVEDNPCVHVFSYTGHKIRALITSGWGLQVNFPYSFCIDPSNTLIFSDYSDRQIKIFSNEGTMLKTLKLLKDDIGMSGRPTGLALTPSLKLVTLCENSKYGVQIFS